MAMALGTTAYDWIILSQQPLNPEELVEADVRTRSLGIGAETTWSVGPSSSSFRRTRVVLSPRRAAVSPASAISTRRLT